jgi:nucleoid-associated protein YgaU
VLEITKPHEEEIPEPAEPEVALPQTEEQEPLPEQSVEPQQLPAETVSADEESIPVAGGGDATLRIERDEEGIISLIIEQERPQPVTETTTVESEEKPDTPPSSEKDIALMPEAVVEESEETPLQPDADWPKPARLVEPCDCIHTVVKGDTLWDIAKRYTKNAFNYPALARESGIHNPHRIYPGDKIRIIVR